MIIKPLTLLALLFSSVLFAQYGSVELNSGGFSPVPAFTDSHPNLVIHAGTSSEKRLSAHLIANVRIEGTYLRSAIFVTRYQLINKRFKLAIATHLPVIQVSEEFLTDTFFAREVTASYELDSNSSLGMLFVRGQGLNNDLRLKLLSLYHRINVGKFSFHTQVFGVDLDNTYGKAENINYRLSDRMFLSAFYNKSLSNGPDNRTIGIGYHF